ncbi:hypothetical protein PUNSTDRAFT_41077 [Punctularia strigosozonata HHB-11173 SS5]|uniref:uncharacterized protein n=1 Tax=Punctularia strigosozonata (strain HHB-11173) TaxID=741275 RepID=UPI0004416E51|nr:uncharacterized protein PUNSTDRAFT_41077 [Punctularia strigosozonata HHB-11173 SS5]EIN13523.1 hypothetical protein PUNSTDRAFT_41077 [Punctularia strigosozonata HHB-11173 SS5]
MASNGQPPCYILVSHPTAPAAGSSATVSSFSHPAIEYNYADDSPMMLLPRHPDEQVLILDYDPADPINPGVKSISSSLAVTGVKVADAPGAGEAQENDKMYIIETTQAAAGDDSTVSL